MTARTSSSSTRRFGRIMGFRSEGAQRAYFDAYDTTLALSPTPLESTEVATTFGKTHVAFTGPDDAPPLLLLHGKNCSSTMWLGLLPTFERTHRTYLIDGIGELGRSVATRMLHGQRDIVQWLSEVVDALHVDRCRVVGLSNGCYQGATFAIARPERVERLAMLAPAAVVCAIRPAWWRKAVATFGNNPAKVEAFWRIHTVNDAPSQLQQRFDDQMLLGFEAIRYAVRDAWPRTYNARQLAALTMPVLIAFAEDDVIHDGRAAADKARRLLPRARVEVVPKCGHMMNFDQPDVVAGLLAEFLDRPVEVG
jgi:pimeloyl-ACP methyl ester carboxylesterase